MYKVIYNSTIIDVIEKPRWVKFLYNINKVTPTDRTSANGILSSDNNTIYILQGNICPEGKSFKTVSLKQIDQSTYYELKNKLHKNENICADTHILTTVRNEKIKSLNEVCNKTITNGVNVLLSDGMYHHFKLTIEDQINLANIQHTMLTTNSNIIYHETGKVCQIYSREDMSKILRDVNNFKNHHTTYFNLLKYCINNMTDVDNINNIKYGDDLLSLNIPSKVRSIVKELQHG